eukprot:CAMPEP_0181298726 /NCGR_PEP_ID=MMETSP1101-20121128/5940_1 /TAXON_ID=46948 /ORGANISM="Rhodomonas abbreviata, Strain Caron Lab Isolate" /LENGTH=271 /DNA_ID=CAMNT_0023403775 /DNA_START=42 /DNA_END=857 /DNA_ORIENTATION=+
MTCAKDIVHVVCPRRRKDRMNDFQRAPSNPIELTLEMLKPFFTKPLTQVSVELGLSVTAIKKACRKFGVSKWPCRTLTSRTSRNRTALCSTLVSTVAANSAALEPCAWAVSAETAKQVIPVQAVTVDMPATNPPKAENAHVSAWSDAMATAGYGGELDSFTRTASSDTGFSLSDSECTESAENEFDDFELDCVSSPLEPVETAPECNPAHHGADLTANKLADDSWVTSKTSLCEQSISRFLSLVDFDVPDAFAPDEADLFCTNNRNPPCFF